MHPKHRHLLALPAFLVLAAIPVLADAHVRLQAMTSDVQEWHAKNESVPVNLPGGHRALLSPGAALTVIGDTVAIEKGSALFLADTIPLQVDAGTWRITGVSGSFHVTRAGQGITVAGITAPAVVSQGTLLAAVPAGYQWKGGNPLPTAQLLAAWHSARTVQRLPQAFLERSIREANDLTDSDAAAADDGIPVDNATGWLLAGMHPLHWQQAWLAPQPISDDAHLLRVLLFPKADEGQIAAPERIRMRWEAAARESVNISKEPDVLLAFILDEIAYAATYFAEHGYPERAEYYRDAADKLHSAYRPIITSSLVSARLPVGKARDDIFPREDITLRDDTTLLEADVQTANEARSILEGIGAMFTAQSRFFATPDGSVRVTGAVFGTPQGDQSVDLTLDMEQNRVSNVSRGGTDYPNTVTLGQLQAWMRGE